MTIEKTLSVQKREGSGKGPAGRARTQDMIPGVFYTAKGDNISVQSPVLPFEKLFAEVGHTTVFHLEIDDNGTKTTYPALVWEVQRHPYKNQYTHIDFYGVDLEKEITVEVPLEFVGVSKGVKLGGILETYREVVRLSSRPLDMPKKITIDVTEMGRTAVFNLEIDDNGTKTVHPVMFWEVQKHPYKKAFTHVDFYGVDLDKEVKVDVPIEFVGVARGVKLGGVMETYRESVRLCSKPLDMPKKVTIDVTDMGINDSVTVETLALPENVKAVFDKNFAIVSVFSKSKDAAEAAE